MRGTWAAVAVAFLVSVCGCGDDDSTAGREGSDENGGDRPLAPEQPRAGANYVHLAADGAVFVIRDTGEEVWTNKQGLRRELERFEASRKPILYSREDPKSDPTTAALANFKLIVEASERANLPIRLLRKPHPAALARDGGCSTGPIARLSAESCFESVVLDRSHQRPVVVLFWARWSGPDRVFKPVVTKAVLAREGRIALVLVNVDEVAAVASRYDVLAIPTLMPFVDGGPAFRRRVGVLSRPELERDLDRVEELARD